MSDRTGGFPFATRQNDEAGGRIMDAYRAFRSLLVFADLGRSDHNGTVTRAGLQSINDGLAVYLGPCRVQNSELFRDGHDCIITAD